MTLILSGTDGLSDVDGTAATPAIRGTDTNTGIFFPAADTIAFSEGGVESMRLDSSGNLAFTGTSQRITGDFSNATVANRVAFQTSTVNGNTTINAIPNGTATQSQFITHNAVDPGNSSRAGFNTTSTLATFFSDIQGTGTFLPMTFNTGGSERMRLDTSGNVGIGTISPAFPLDVQCDTAAFGVRLRGRSSDNISVLRFVSNNVATTYGQLDVRSDIFIINAVANSPIAFNTNNTERARIDTSGRLLIGTSTVTNGTRLMAYDGSTTSSTLGGFYAGSTSYASSVQVNWCDRSGNSAYNFFVTRSNNDSDTEHSLRGDGNAYADGTWNNNGADYAEFFESATGSALTLGATVVLDGNKVREATIQDPASSIMGVVRPKEPSKASMVVGNTAWNKWANKYLTDDFDRYIMEDHNVLEWTDEEGKQHSYESHHIPAGVTVPNNAVVKTHDEKGNKFQHYKLNPAWNPDVEYVSRENRPEWIIVGLVGQVKILKGQPVNDRWIKMRDVSATVEEWMIR